VASLNQCWSAPCAVVGSAIFPHVFPASCSDAALVDIRDAATSVTYQNGNRMITFPIGESHRLIPQ